MKHTVVLLHTVLIFNVKKIIKMKILGQSIKNKVAVDDSVEK